MTDFYSALRVLCVLFGLACMTGLGAESVYAQSEPPQLGLQASDAVVTRSAAKQVDIDFGSINRGSFEVLRYTFPELPDPEADILVTNILVFDGDSFEPARELAQAGGFYVDPVASLPFLIPAGEQRDILISFAPLVEGLQSAFIEIQYEIFQDPASEFVSVQGNGVGPVGVVPFGQVAVGSDEVLELFFTNGDELTLRLPSTVIDPSTADFDVLLGPGGVIVPPFSQATFDAVFAPMMAGVQRARVFLDVLNDESGNQLAILPLDLEGEGVIAQPAITVSPASVNFGLQELGVAAITNVLVRNSGNGDLEIGSLLVSGMDAIDFEVLTDPFTLPPGGSEGIAVQFTPSAVGLRQATLEIASNDPMRPTVLVPLNGEGEEPGVPLVTVTPLALDFGPVALGASEALDINIANPGTADLLVSGITLSGLASGDYSVPDGAFTLPPGESRLVPVVFEPLGRGDRLAQATVLTNANDVRVSLTGVGAAPTLQVANAVVFPTTLVGEEALQSLTLTNVGDAPLDVSSVRLEGGGAVFAISGGRPVPLIAPGGSHTLELSFRPLEAEAYDATLRILSNDPDRPDVVVPLSGSGERTLTLDIEAVTFGDVRVGSVATATVTVQNPSSEPRTVSAITLDGAASFSVEPTTGFTLPPGGSQPLTVRYAPTARGAEDAVLQIEPALDPEDPLSVPISGNGVAPIAAVEPASLSFPLTLSGFRRTQPVQVRNVGDAELVITSTQAGGADAAAFAATAPTQSVQPGAAQPVLVTFAPQRDGSFSATLNIATNDPQNPTLTIPLSGTAGVPRNDTPAVVDAGQAIPVSITVPVVPDGVVGRLLYRQTGAPTYIFQALEEAGGTFTGTIQGDFVTERGIQYYFQFTNEAGTLTVPVSEPEANPLQVRVRAATVTAPRVLPVVADAASPVAAYTMHTIPFEIENASVASVFQDDFGTYDPAEWRILRWDAQRQAYEEFPFSAPYALGRGFWLIRREGGTYDVENVTSTPAGQPLTLTLPPGWSQIGSPFAFPVQWTQMEVGPGIGLPVAWRGGQYVPGQAVLQPWEGYFVFNGGGSPSEVRFLPLEAGAAARETEASPLVAGWQEQGAYAVQLAARAPARGLLDEHTYFVLDAGTGKARMQAVPEPPAPADGLQVAIAEGADRFMVQPKPANTDGQQWDVVVNGPSSLTSSRLEASFALHEYGRRPEGFGLWVVDTDTRELLASVPPEGAAEAAAFTLKLTEGTPTRRLQLVVGTGAFAAEATEGASLGPAGLQANYPNPFAGATQVVYRLEAASEVTLSVYDALGRRVRTLAQGRQGAGRYEVAWDGRDASGVPVASGVYVVRLAAGAHRSTRRLLLIR